VWEIFAPGPAGEKEMMPASRGCQEVALCVVLSFLAALTSCAENPSPVFTTNIVRSERTQPRQSAPLINGFCLILLAL